MSAGAAEAPGEATLALPPGARARVAAWALPAALSPLLLGGLLTLALVRAGRPAVGLGLLLGAGLGAVLAVSWVLGTLLCFHRSLTALQASTLALWPVRVGGLIGALVYARSRELDQGAVFLGLLGAHVLALVVNARATGALAQAAKDARSCMPPAVD